MNNETQETTKVECLLRIENQAKAFTKDLKILINQDLLKDDSWEFEDIYLGASQTLIQKYLPVMKLQGTVISLLRPIELSQDDFTEFLEDIDTNKAKADINAILSSLPEDKRAIVLQSLRDK